jgi:hypothetical protein
MELAVIVTNGRDELQKVEIPPNDGSGHVGKEVDVPGRVVGPKELDHRDVFFRRVFLHHGIVFNNVELAVPVSFENVSAHDPNSKYMEKDQGSHGSFGPIFPLGESGKDVDDNVGVDSIPNWDQKRRADLQVQYKWMNDVGRESR